MRSRHNLSSIALPSDPIALDAIVTGFLHDRWEDGLKVLEIQTRMAARYGTRDLRHADARKIVEAYHDARPRYLL